MSESLGTVQGAGGLLRDSRLTILSQLTHHGMYLSHEAVGRVNRRSMRRMCCSNLPDPSADAPAASRTSCWRAGASSTCCRVLYAAGGWPISTGGNAEDTSLVACNAVDRSPVLDGQPRLALLVGAIMKNQIIGANIE